MGKSSKKGNVSWHILIAFAAIFSLALYGLFIFASHPRAVNVVMNDAAQTAAQVKDAVNPAAAPGTPLPPLDKTLYDAKMLALANCPKPPKAPVTASTSTPKTASGTAKGSVAGASPIAKIAAPTCLWPAKPEIYPNAGALLPFRRIVAYYGNLYSTQMGVLGEYPEDQMLAMLASTTAEWTAADPSTPAVPALEYIAVTAQGLPGSDGKYRLRMPDSQIDKILDMANRINAIVILDIQTGGSTVEDEIPLLEKYLAMPNVELALDPEFSMHNGARPGTVIGTMDASDINFAAQYLARLVQKNGLPPKILVIHRFTQAMVTNYKQITPLPEVQIVMDMDGFGPPAKKVSTYRSFIASEPVQFTGFKLFYKNDIREPGSHLMSPAEVFALTPKPIFIQYE